MRKGRESKPHIGIFGRRNNGKSSFINAITGQNIAIVSEVAGTTNDPVKKSIEISGIGPVILIDTAGIDDVGDLGEKRVAKTISTLKLIDLAILIVANNEFGQIEEDLITRFQNQNLPFIILHNKSDIAPLDGALAASIKSRFSVDVIDFSAKNFVNKEQVIKLLRHKMPANAYKSSSLVAGLIDKNDMVLLITPIDNEAPEGRLILPQVKAIRDIIDANGICVVCKETEVEKLLKVLKPRPRIAITDSQIFAHVDAIVPDDIALTGFSILFARLKGNFAEYLKGTPKIDDLEDGDRILLLESCTHHVACDDIGRIKIPRWIDKHTGKKLEYEVVSGLSDLPRPIKDYALVIQCGGCVVTKTQLNNRLAPAIEAEIPITNYGMAIAWLHGTYKRAIAPFYP